MEGAHIRTRNLARGTTLLIFSPFIFSSFSLFFFLVSSAVLFSFLFGVHRLILCRFSLSTNHPIEENKRLAALGRFCRLGASVRCATAHWLLSNSFAKMRQEELCRFQSQNLRRSSYWYDYQTNYWNEEEHPSGRAFRWEEYVWRLLIWLIEGEWNSSFISLDISGSKICASIPYQWAQCAQCAVVRPTLPVDSPGPKELPEKELMFRLLS